MAKRATSCELRPALNVPNNGCLIVSLPVSSTEDEIGEAEAYKAAVIFSQNPGVAAPAWLVNLNATVAQTSANTVQMQANITSLLQKADEIPILFINSQAGHTEQLQYLTGGHPHSLHQIHRPVTSLLLLQVHSVLFLQLFLGCLPLLHIPLWR